MTISHDEMEKLHDELWALFGKNLISANSYNALWYAVAGMARGEAIPNKPNRTSVNTVIDSCVNNDLASAIADMFNAEGPQAAPDGTLVAALEVALGQRMDRIADQLEQLVGCFKRP